MSWWSCVGVCLEGGVGGRYSGVSRGRETWAVCGVCVRRVERRVGVRVGWRVFDWGRG